MQNHQLINATSGEVEYYTPVEIIEAARRVMGGIDLDPASSENANRIVRATRIFTAQDDGLSQPWNGRVWLTRALNDQAELCQCYCHLQSPARNVKSTSPATCSISAQDLVDRLAFLLGAETAFSAATVSDLGKSDASTGESLEESSWGTECKSAPVVTRSSRQSSQTLRPSPDASTDLDRGVERVSGNTLEPKERGLESNQNGGDDSTRSSEPSAAQVEGRHSEASTALSVTQDEGSAHLAHPSIGQSRNGKIASADGNTSVPVVAKLENLLKNISFRWLIQNTPELFRPTCSPIASRVITASGSLPRVEGELFGATSPDCENCHYEHVRVTFPSRVFMNHPFGRPEKACEAPCANRGKTHVCHDYDLYGNATWVNKLAREYYEGRTVEACNITYAATSEAWFQPLAKRPQCFLVPRTNYRLPDGTIKKGVSKGSVVTYFGNNIDAFAREYSAFGVVKVAYT